tara:strand:- start:8801 stop:9721 length:921 start_codon:yes stop_codon:yes gene_type:complete
MELVIHIGYPKCASTTLQKHLFARHPDISYLGIYPESNVGYDNQQLQRPCLALDDEKIKLLHETILSDDFEENKINYKSSINNIIESVSIDKKLMILSNERFTSSVFTKSDITIYAKRLSYLFPGAKILMIVRDPFDLLLSQYRDQPFDPRDISNSGFLNFDEWLSIIFEYRQDILESLKFENIYGLYSELFGEGNVLILRLEKLNEVSNELGKFLKITEDPFEDYLKGKKENLGTSEAFTRYRRLVRQLKKIIPQNRFSNFVKEKMTNLAKTALPKGRKKILFSSSSQSRVNKYFEQTKKFIELI